MMDCGLCVSDCGNVEVLWMVKENFEPRRRRAHPNLAETGG
jgi:hypothetical protein